MIDPLTVLVLSASLALLFFTAAKHKLYSPGRFRAQLAAYELVPSVILPSLARAIPLAEMAVFFLILLPFTRTWAAVLASGLLTSYTVAMAMNMLRGRDDIDCGCGGQQQILSYWLLLRNAVLIIGCLLLIIPSTDRALVWTDFILLTLILAVLCCAYLLVEQLVRDQTFSKSRRVSHG